MYVCNFPQQNRDCMQNKLMSKFPGAKKSAANPPPLYYTDNAVLWPKITLNYPARTRHRL